LFVGWKKRLAIGAPAILGGALLLGLLVKIIQIKRMRGNIFLIEILKYLFSLDMVAKTVIPFQQIA